jgi:hypothetical protein
MICFYFAFFLPSSLLSSSWDEHSLSLLSPQKIPHVNDVNTSAIRISQNYALPGSDGVLVNMSIHTNFTGLSGHVIPLFLSFSVALADPLYSSLFFSFSIMPKPQLFVSIATCSCSISATMKLAKS